MQLIGSQELRRHWGKVLDDLSTHRDPIIVIRHSSPVAVLVGYDEWNSIARRLTRASQRMEGSLPAGSEVTQKIT